MTNLEESAKLWHDKSFGEVEPAPTYRKLLEEVGELGEALMESDPGHIAEEIGDVGLVLMHLARVSPRPSLMVLIGEALDKCEDRRHRNHLFRKP